MRHFQRATVNSVWQMVAPYKVSVDSKHCYLCYYCQEWHPGQVFHEETTRIAGRGARGDGDDSLLTEMFKSERLSSYPELLLQAQPVVGSPGVVKPLQMALQRAHIQLRVSVQIVLQQSLVDEGVLHLRRETRGSQGDDEAL